jgi:hypothetical protein
MSLLHRIKIKITLFWEKGRAFNIHKNEIIIFLILRLAFFHAHQHKRHAGWIFGRKTQNIIQGGSFWIITIEMYKIKWVEMESDMNSCSKEFFEMIKLKIIFVLFKICMACSSFSWQY